MSWIRFVSAIISIIFALVFRAFRNEQRIARTAEDLDRARANYMMVDEAEQKQPQISVNIACINELSPVLQELERAIFSPSYMGPRRAR